MSRGGFRSLEVWKKSKLLAVEIYRVTSEGDIARDHGLREQMRRAAVSVCSNIAEGDERETDKESIRFFYVSKGSVAELIAQIEIAEAVGYLHDAQSSRLASACDEIARMLRGLIAARSS